MSRPADQNRPPLQPGPCAAVEPDILHHALDRTLAAAGLSTSLRATHPDLFSDSSVFVAPTDLDSMRAVIRAVERVISLPVFREQALATAPSTAAHDPRALGAFFGYDFHLGSDGPRLIEINTNAGGALLSLALLRANLQCCPPLQHHLPETGPDEIEAQIIAMFRQEWALARGQDPLRRVAIVDDQPENQYLYPEFTLFQALFRRQEIDALVADAGSLQARDGRLWAGTQAIDLVYNRLTDFSLEQPGHAALRTAWLNDLAVITPHPRAHALYADKRILAMLTDDELLRSAGADPQTMATLASGVARTRRVRPEQAETLWAERKKLFFKPVSGYGSKAVYRGDKLTRRVWDEILAADYVAQTLVPPAELPVGPDQAVLKCDLRAYAYQGRIQLWAARLYQGQTTNFRTPGGGFAPVFTHLAKSPA